MAQPFTTRRAATTIAGAREEKGPLRHEETVAQGHRHRDNGETVAVTGGRRVGRCKRGRRYILRYTVRRARNKTSISLIRMSAAFVSIRTRFALYNNPTFDYQI